MSEENLIDLDHLEKISGGNRSFVREILGVFLEQTPRELEQLEKHIDENNFEKVEYFAHKLKSASDSIGFSEGRQLFKQIEDSAHARSADEIPKLYSQIEEICNEAFIQVKRKLEAGL